MEQRHIRLRYRILSFYDFEDSYRKNRRNCTAFMEVNYEFASPGRERTVVQHVTGDRQYLDDADLADRSLSEELTSKAAAVKRAAPEL